MVTVRGAQDCGPERNAQHGSDGHGTHSLKRSGRSIEGGVRHRHVASVREQASGVGVKSDVPPAQIVLQIA
jgi:hypothetical protein